VEVVKLLERAVNFQQSDMPTRPATFFDVSGDVVGSKAVCGGTIAQSAFCGGCAKSINNFAFAHGTSGLDKSTPRNGPPRLSKAPKAALLRLALRHVRRAADIWTYDKPNRDGVVGRTRGRRTNFVAPERGGRAVPGTIGTPTASPYGA